MNLSNQVINTEHEPAPGNHAFEPGANFAFLAVTARKILVEEDISLVLQSICHEACGVLGADRAMIAKIRADGNNKREILYAYNIPREYLDKIQASDSNPIFESALLEKKIKIFSNLSKETTAFQPEDIRRMGIHTICAIPLIIGNEAFGALILYHLSPRDYSTPDINLAETFGDLASIAIEKAQLVGSLHSRVSGQEGLEHAVRYVASGQSVDEIAQMVMAESERVMGTNRCSVILLEAGDENPRLFVSRGVSDEFRKSLQEERFNTSSSLPLAVYRYIQNPYLTTPTIVPDVAISTDLSDSTKQFQLDHGHRALAAFPLLIDGKSTGLLFYYWTIPQEIDELRISMGQAFADHVAIAIDKARRSQENKEKALRFEVVDQMTRAINSNLEPDELFQVMAREIRRAVQCDRLLIARRRAEGNEFHQYHEEGDVPLLPMTETDWKNALLSKEVYQTRQLVNVPELSESRWRHTRLSKMNYQSALVVPIFREDECIAIIRLASREAGAFSRDTEELLTSLSGHLSTAIQNAELYKTAEERTARLEIIANIARAVGSELELEELFKTIVSEIRPHIPFIRCVFPSITGWGNFFQAEWNKESDIMTSAFKGREDFREWILREVYQPRKPKIIPDLREFGAEWATLRANDGFRSMMLVPIVLEGQCIAHIGVSDDRVGVYTNEHESLLTAIAGYLGYAIRNADLFKAAGHRAARLSALNDLAQKISENLNLQEVLDNIARATADLLEGDATRILLLDEDTNILHLRAYHGYDPGDPNRKDAFQLGEGFIGNMVLSNEEVTVDDIQGDPMWINADWAREAGLHSIAGHPLRKGQRAIGGIMCLSKKTGAYSQEDVDLLGALASHAVAAIENARLHEEANRSREFFQSVVDDNADAIMVLDLDRNFIHWNAGAEKLYGYTDTEILGKNINIILPESQKGLNLTEEISRTKKPIHFEAERLRKDGSLIPVSISVSPVIDEKGEFIATATTHKDLTEQKAASEALRESEERYRNLIEFAADAIYVHDTDGKFINVNQRACESLGYTREELLNMSVKDISPTFNREGFRNQWKNLNQGEQIIFENTHKRKDGTIFPIELHTGKIESNGQWLVLSLVRDISERKAAAAAIQKSEASLANAQRIARIGNWEWNIQTGESNWSDEVYRIYGLPPDSDTPTHELFFNCLHPQDREIVRQTLGEAIHNKQPYRLDHRIIRPDGGVRYVHEEAEIKIDEAGAPLMFIGTSQDITERKRAEEALRISEDRIRRIYGAASDAIFVLDVENECIVETNPKAAALLGYSQEEMYGLPISKVHPTEMPRMRKIISALQSKSESLSNELSCTTKSNKKIPVEISFSMFQIEDRDYVMAIARDIRERKEAESKLLLAMAKAEAASQAKSDFLSNMSHELRSPLNSIVGFSDILMRDSGDEITQTLAPKIKDSGHYLTSLIEDILDFDRIESGKVKLEMKTTPINDLVRNVVETQTPQLTESHSMELHLDSTCGTVSCDPTRINQVLINLLDNAVKYSPDGGTIHVRTLSKGEEIWVSVDDNGLGISPHEKESIFERFHQLESGYQRRSGGLGIGLSLIRQLIQLHGGRIWVESEINKGSIFTFTLPKQPVRSPDTKKGTSAGKDIPTGSNPWERKSILIVDDVQHYHVYIRLLMAGAKEIISANNGEEAIAAVEQTPPDLILMDLRMPLMNGFEAIKKLKSNPATRDIPIIAVSAQVTDEDKKAAAQAGANGFISKPIDIDALKKEIFQVLSMSE